MIGHLDAEKHARRFGDFLYLRGIENEVEPESGAWSIWICDEEEVEEARALLDKFQSDPDHAEFRVDSDKIQKRKEKEAKEHEAYRKRVHDGRQLLNRFGSYGAGPFTSLLIAGCVLVALISQFGSNTDALLPFFITKYQATGGGVSALPEIRHGEVWRIFTPMLIHFGLMHLFFNMLWLFHLGSMIESRQGTWFLVPLILSIAGVSNLAQFFVSGPAFGGMSGVVFGLFGYIWTKTKFDPHSGYFLDQMTVVLMVVWFFLCLTGFVGAIANVVHAVGLGLGMLWGFLNSQFRRF